MTAGCDLVNAKTYMPSGECEGKLLIYNDNRQGTFRCERHARMVEAWIKTPGHEVPISAFLGRLTPIEWIGFLELMRTVSLRDWLDYVPKFERPTAKPKRKGLFE